MLLITKCSNVTEGVREPVKVLKTDGERKLKCSHTINRERMLPVRVLKSGQYGRNGRFLFEKEKFTNVSTFFLG